MIREAAGEVKALLDELGVVGHPKTTGNKGLHIYVRLQPRWDSYEVRAAAVALARELERRRPDLLTAAWWKEERGQRVFIDFNQNAPAQDDLRGVVGAGPASAPRCRRRSPGTRSTTVHPDELTIATVPDRVRATATRGPTWSTTRSRSSRCSSGPPATWPPA